MKLKVFIVRKDIRQKTIIDNINKLFGNNTISKAYFSLACNGKRKFSDEIKRKIIVSMADLGLDESKVSRIKELKGG